MEESISGASEERVGINGGPEDRGETDEKFEAKAEQMELHKHMQKSWPSFEWQMNGLNEVERFYVDARTMGVL